MSNLRGNETASSTSYKARLISDHIRVKLGKRENASAPLMVAMQGPQGCGKTTLCNAIKSLLDHESLRVAILSLDDLYLPYYKLKALSENHPTNKLLSGRGQPGTHDLELGSITLEAIRHINEDATNKANLPIFDKSLHCGKGDRSDNTVLVQAPIDVFILEGWSMGFAHLEQADLERRYSEGCSASASQRSYFTSHSLEALLTLNENLKLVAPALYPPFTVFVQIQPSSLMHVFHWRLEQEHHMKSLNGGRGMTDAEVHAFVERYIPGYELWGNGVTEGTYASGWIANGYRLVYGSDREVVRTEVF